MTSSGSAQLSSCTSPPPRRTPPARAQPLLGAPRTDPGHRQRGGRGARACQQRQGPAYGRGPQGGGGGGSGRRPRCPPPRPSLRGRNRESRRGSGEGRKKRGNPALRSPLRAALRAPTGRPRPQEPSPGPAGGP